jgi:hypothetical protein
MPIPTVSASPPAPTALRTLFLSISLLDSSL